MSKHGDLGLTDSEYDLILEKIAAGTAPWLKPWTSTSTRPLLGFNWALIRRRMVVLPLPEPPISATTSPRRKTRFRSDKIGRSP